MTKSVSASSQHTRPRFRAWLWLPALFLLGLVFWFGRNSVNMDPDIAAGFMGSVDPRLAWVVALLVFLVGSFLGVPQFMLIAGAVIAFGPWQGALMSWVGSMLSHTVHFGMGQAMGGERLRARLEAKGRRRALEWMERLRRNGILSSAAIRIVPTGPALFVNMAAGASDLRFRDYLIGTAIGIVPKIAVIALFGKGLGEWFLGGGAGPSLAVLALAVALIVFLYWLRRRYRKSRQALVPPAKNIDQSEASP